jgi:hypothetical protein
MPSIIDLKCAKCGTNATDPIFENDEMIEEGRELFLMTCCRQIRCFGCRECECAERKWVTIASPQYIEYMVVRGLDDMASIAERYIEKLRERLGLKEIDNLVDEYSDSFFELNHEWYLEYSDMLSTFKSQVTVHRPCVVCALPCDLGVSCENDHPDPICGQCALRIADSTGKFRCPLCRSNFTFKPKRFVGESACHTTMLSNRMVTDVEREPSQIEEDFRYMYEQYKEQVIGLFGDLFHDERIGEYFNLGFQDQHGHEIEYVTPTDLTTIVVDPHRYVYSSVWL